jgi:hypothetical protein
MTRAEKRAAAFRALGNALLALADDTEDEAPISSPATVYVIDRAGPLPPEKKHKLPWLRRNVPNMPGAYKVKRTWAISAADWQAWLASQRRPKKTVAAPLTKSIADDAQAAIEAAGVRLTRRSA